MHSKEEKKILVVILVVILTGKSSMRLIHSAEPQLLGCHKRHKPIIEISLVLFVLCQVTFDDHLDLILLATNLGWKWFST